jgi:hypothetical protein
MHECCEQVEELVNDSETSNSVRDEPNTSVNINTSQQHNC